MRHVDQAELLGRQDPPVPRNNPPGLVEKNRRRPAPFPNRRNELIHLFRAVRSRIACIRLKIGNLVAFNLIRRPGRWLRQIPHPHEIFLCKDLNEGVARPFIDPKSDWGSTLDFFGMGIGRADPISGPRRDGLHIRPACCATCEGRAAQGGAGGSSRVARCPLPVARCACTRVHARIDSPTRKKRDER
jgi:hypothetical protein